MKIVVASDKWRGTFTSSAAGIALATGVERASPGAEVVVVPLADGGEGTLEVVEESLGGDRRTARVSGPLGDPVLAPWMQLSDGRAVVEAAAAAGLALVEPDARDPLSAGTRGVGELLLAALDGGCRGVVLALGGVATVDGGAGMAQALGYRLLDSGGVDLPAGGGGLASLASIDGSAVDPRVADLSCEAWCDVANPLLGPRGSASTYGPQKGADDAAVERLERGLERLARVASTDLSCEVADLPGAGAAGGLGAGAAAFLGADLASGAGRVLEMVGFDAILAGADLVVTGEGHHDPDAMPGKLPDVVLARAASCGVPAVVVCGDCAGAEPVAEEQGPRIYSRHDLIDDRGWDLGEGDLIELGELVARRELERP